MAAQILFADDAPIHHPDAPGLAVFALHHAQNRLHGGDVGTIPIESFVAEGKTFTVDDRRFSYLLAVGPMIPRVAAPHHRIVLRCPFHIRAGQVVEQDIELGYPRGLMYANHTNFAPRLGLAKSLTYGRS